MLSLHVWFALFWVEIKLTQLVLIKPKQLPFVSRITRPTLGRVNVSMDSVQGGMLWEHRLGFGGMPRQPNSLWSPRTVVTSTGLLAVVESTMRNSAGCWRHPGKHPAPYYVGERRMQREAYRKSNDAGGLFWDRSFSCRLSWGENKEQRAGEEVRIQSTVQ